MTPWEVALQITKFIALAVSAASGVYATIADTRDKESGKLTRAGRVVFECVILSLVVGLTIQALDTKSTIDKLKNEAIEKKTAADKEEAKRRIDADARAAQMNQLQSILETAKDASKQSKASATQSATAVQGLGAITAGQSIGLEKSWRQERPFGQWKARLTVWGVHLGDTEWIKRILAYSHQPYVMPIHNLLVFSTEDIPLPEFSARSRVWFGDPLDPIRYPHGDPNILGFDLEPTLPKLISAHINEDKTGVTSFDLPVMEVDCKQRVGIPIIRNWIDLYGREMTLDLDDKLAVADIISFYLYYEDTNESHKLTYTCEHCGHATKGSTLIRTILTERELGAFPSDYKTLFPSEFKEIENRMRRAGLDTAK